jgi:thiol-disulfide isomerase/thioredoxin
MKKLLIALLATTGLWAQSTEVKLSAEIKNPTADSLVIAGRGFRQVLKASKPGVFNGSFEIKAAEFYQVFLGQDYTIMYLKSGFDLKMAADSKNFQTGATFTGTGAPENNFIAKKLSDNSMLSEIMDTGNDEAAMNSQIERLFAGQEAMLNDTAIDETFRTQMKQQLTSEKEQVARMITSAVSANAMKGRPSPQFDYEDPNGGCKTLADFKGKYVYIDVWATWCGPCRREIPYLKEVEGKYHGKNIAFISISIDEHKDYNKWKNMVVSQQLGGTQLFAENAWQSGFTQAYGINSIPRFLLIDPQGNVVESNAKRPSDPKLQEQLDKLLN